LKQKNLIVKHDTLVIIHVSTFSCIIKYHKAVEATCLHYTANYRPIYMYACVYISCTFVNNYKYTMQTRLDHFAVQFMYTPSRLVL